MYNSTTYALLLFSRSQNYTADDFSDESQLNIMYQFNIAN